MRDAISANESGGTVSGYMISSGVIRGNQAAITEERQIVIRGNQAAITEEGQIVIRGNQAAITEERQIVP